MCDTVRYGMGNNSSLFFFGEDDFYQNINFDVIKVSLFIFGEILSHYCTIVDKSSQ